MGCDIPNPNGSMFSISEEALKRAKRDDMDAKKVDMIISILTLDSEPLTLKRVEKLLERVNDKIRECRINLC